MKSSPAVPPERVIEAARPVRPGPAFAVTLLVRAAPRAPTAAPPAS